MTYTSSSSDSSDSESDDEAALLTSDIAAQVFNVIQEIRAGTLDVKKQYFKNGNSSDREENDAGKGAKDGEEEREKGKEKRKSIQEGGHNAQETSANGQEEHKSERDTMKAERKRKRKSEKDGEEDEVNRKEKKESKAEVKARAGDGKRKKVTIRDYQREEMINEFNEREGDAQSASEKGFKTHDQTLEQLRVEAKKAADAIKADLSDVEEEDDIGFMKVSRKDDSDASSDDEDDKTESTKEPILRNKEYKKSVLKAPILTEETKPMLKSWEKEQGDEGFLMKYLLNQGWKDESTAAEQLPSLEELQLKRQREIGELSDIDELEKAEEFEAAYNFRFEEQDATQIKLHPRQTTESIRRVDTSRKDARANRDERKISQKQQQVEELKRLKNLKKKEIKAKLKETDPTAVDDLLDSLYEMDHEDIIDDLPTRFKYGKSDCVDFGLTDAEILLADEGDLNDYAPMKKYAPFRDPIRVRSDKRKITSRDNVRQFKKKTANLSWEIVPVDTEVKVETAVETNEPVKEAELTEAQLKKRAKKARQKETRAALKAEQKIAEKPVHKSIAPVPIKRMAAYGLEPKTKKKYKENK